jgi:hypothetical protein
VAADSAFGGADETAGGVASAMSRSKLSSSSSRGRRFTEIDRRFDALTRLIRAFIKFI